MVRISPGPCQELKNWNLLQSGQALGIMTVAGKFSNADAIFVGVRSCCLLHTHRNNLVEDQVFAVGNGRALQHPKQISARAMGGHISCVVHCLYSQLRCMRTLRKMFSCLRRSDRMGHVCIEKNIVTRVNYYFTLSELSGSDFRCLICCYLCC